MLYRRIRDTREDQDKTQNEIAQYLGISQTQYSRYERGANEIPLHYIIMVADFLHVSLDYLTGRTDEPQNPNVIS